MAQYKKMLLIKNAALQKEDKRTTKMVEAIDKRNQEFEAEAAAIKAVAMAQISEMKYLKHVVFYKQIPTFIVFSLVVFSVEKSRQPNWS